MNIYQLWYRLKEFTRIALARLRVHWTRWQGGRQIHPKCLFGSGVKIERPWLIKMGQRCVLQPSVWLNLVEDGAHVEIGNSVFIGRGTEIEASCRIEIGSDCLIGPGVYITDHNHGMKNDQTMNIQECVPSPVVIEEDVWIGARCILLPGVTVGKGAILGAGSVITKNVDAHSVVAGVPARFIRTRK